MFTGQVDRAQICLNQATYITQKYNINFNFDTDAEHYVLEANEEIENISEENLEIIKQDEYGLRLFLGSVWPNYDNRCEYCYTVRLESTARIASERGYTHFSTTLLISPYQNHDLIRSIAQKIGEKYGVEFLYHDFRPYFREGQKIAREKGIYMQKYCGCIFSEEERYIKIKS